MAQETFGDFDWYYPQGTTLKIPYKLEVTTETEPAEDITLAEARIYAHGEVGDANLLTTVQLRRSHGDHELLLDISDYTVDQSPLIVEFVFTKEFSSGPKAGTTETTARPLGVVLAAPAVAELEATPAFARAGDSVEVKVKAFGAFVYDAPRAAPAEVTTTERDGAPVDPERFPQGSQKSDVVWFKGDEELGAAESHAFTWDAADDGKTLTFKASLAEQPDPAAADVVGSGAVLRLRYQDPLDADAVWLFPADLPVKVVYDDGSETDAAVGDDGLLKLALDRSKQSFGLRGEHPDPTFIAHKAGESPRLLAESDVQGARDDGWSVYRLPEAWSLTEGWTVTGEGSSFDAEAGHFAELGVAERAFGSDAEPLQLVFGPEVATAHRMEMEDFNFHHGSAILLPESPAPDDAPEERLTALDLLRACLLHAEANPGQKLLIAGHTDTSGGADFNLQLSERRAKAVYHVLMGQKDEWVALCEDGHEVEDVQRILKWANKQQPWFCDPGKVDDQDGPATRKGLKQFHVGYNLTFERSIPESEEVGRETWEAVFDLYARELARSLDTDAAGLDQRRQALAFCDPPTVGCGEAHPIEAAERDNYRSAINRRVELLFFDAPAEGEEETAWKCHASEEGAAAATCRLYDPRQLRFEPIEPEAPAKREVPVQLLYEDETPMANARFEAVFAEGTEEEVRAEGTTGADGRAKVECPPGVGFFRLLLGTYPSTYVDGPEEGSPVEHLWPHSILAALLVAVGLAISCGAIV